MKRTLLALALMLAALPGWAQTAPALTTPQLQAIKAVITADPVLNGKPNNNDANTEIADALDLDASPDFWVWRPSVSRVEIYNKVSPTGSMWDWTVYKNQGVPEQNAWVQMFMGDAADFSQQNLRDGIGKIFGASSAQTLHALAMGRQKASRAEKVLAIGTGSPASPAVFGFREGKLTADEVSSARAAQ